MLYTISFLSSK